jgi:hypothetical protein
MCLAHNANAQYLPAQIHRDGADFVNEAGRVLSDQELVNAVGADIYTETVVGARKQYKAGRALVISGAAGLGVGVTSFLGGLLLIAAAGPEQRSDGQVYFDDDDLAAAGGGAVLLGSLATALGGTALSVGIPLKAIGQSRLNWVENDYNGHQGYSIHFGSTPSGVGIALRF